MRGLLWFPVEMSSLSHFRISPEPVSRVQPRVLPCSSDPSCFGLLSEATGGETPPSVLNAVAVRHILFTLTPLLI